MEVLAAGLRIDFTSEEDPLAMLATFIELATPTFQAFGFSPEHKDPRSARDWMHWNRDLHDLVRAYAFRDGSLGGVSIIGQGQVPDDLRNALIQRVATSTHWDIADPS